MRTDPSRRYEGGTAGRPPQADTFIAGTGCHNVGCLAPHSAAAAGDPRDARRAAAGPVSVHIAFSAAAPGSNGVTEPSGFGGAGLHCTSATRGRPIQYTRAAACIFPSRCSLRR